MRPGKPYFSLYELSVLSICGGLIFVLKTAFKIPLHLPGHSGIFWVIPVMFAVAVVRKPGSGTYVGTSQASSPPSSAWTRSGSWTA